MTAQKNLINQFGRKTILMAMNADHLSDRNRSIIKSVYEGASYAEAAKMAGVSAVRVKQIIINNCRRAQELRRRSTAPFPENLNVPVRAHNVIKNMGVSEAELRELLSTYEGARHVLGQQNFGRLSMQSLCDALDVPNLTSALPPKKSPQNLTYDWEKKITQDMMDKIDAILPRGISLMGLAVANVFTAEAALIRDAKHSFGVVADVDMWQDVMGDVEQTYAKVMEESETHFRLKRADSLTGG